MQYVDHIYGMVGGFYYPVLKYFYMVYRIPHGDNIVALFDI